MVRFLLHNTLGAWWAAKVLAAEPTLARIAADENELRAACSLPDYSFDMLRFVREGENGPWRPAAGTFPGWPTEAKAITMLDPCCGSGHFLTEALAILAALRHTEEGLSLAEAVATLYCGTICTGSRSTGAASRSRPLPSALTAWRIGGWRALPLPHIAWVGAPPPLPRREFVALADGDPELEYALAAAPRPFRRRPTTWESTSELPRWGATSSKPRRCVSDPATSHSRLLSKARSAEPEIGRRHYFSARNGWTQHGSTWLRSKAFTCCHSATNCSLSQAQARQRLVRARLRRSSYCGPHVGRLTRPKGASTASRGHPRFIASAIGESATSRTSPGTARVAWINSASASPIKSWCFLPPPPF